MKQIYRTFLFKIFSYTFIAGCILFIINAPLSAMAPKVSPMPTTDTFNQVLEKIKNSPPTKSALATLGNNVQQTQKGIPPQCQQELKIALEDFAAKIQLAERTSTKVNKHIAKIAAMQQLYPEKMTQIAQNTFGKRMKAAIGGPLGGKPFVASPNIPMEQGEFAPVTPLKPIEPISVKPIEQIQVIEKAPKPQRPLMLGPPSPTPGLAKKMGVFFNPPSKQIEEPEITEAEKNLREVQEEPSTIVIPETEPNELIRKALKEFMTREYGSEKYAQALKQQHGAKKTLPALSLITLHTHIFYAASNEMTANALQPLLEECLDYSKELVYLFEQTKPNELDPDLQEQLEKVFAYILVCFDALVQASEKGLPGILTGFGSWFGGEPYAVKQERVKHTLDIFYPPIKRTIDLFDQKLADYCAPTVRKAFNAGKFDVAEITGISEKIAGQEVYPYGHNNVGPLHKKKYDRVITGLYRAAGAAELEPIVFSSATMQECWVNLQKIVTSLEQIVNKYDQKYGEDWSVSAVDKDDTESVTLMFLDALDAQSCLEVPEQEKDLEPFVASTYKKATLLIDRILGKEEREGIQDDYNNALILIEETEEALKDVSAHADSYDKRTLEYDERILEELKKRLTAMDDLINPDRYKMIMEKLNKTLEWLEEELADKEQQEEAEQKPTATEQPSVLPTPTQQPVPIKKVEPEVVLPPTIQPPAKHKEKFVPIKQEPKEVEEELPEKASIVPEELQGPTAQEKIRESLRAISKDIQSLQSKEQAGKLEKTLEDIAISGEADENNQQLLLHTQKLLKNKLFEIEAQKIQKRLNAFIASLKEATRMIANNDNATIENQMITKDDLNTHLKYYTDTKNLVLKDFYDAYTARLTTELKNYCAALVKKIVLDATVDETSTISIHNLHKTARDNPQDIEQWGTVPTTILETDAAKSLVYTLERIQTADIIIELDELDAVLAALCASFDACMAALYDSEKIATIITPHAPDGEPNLPAVTNIKPYLELLDKIALTFAYIENFMVQYGNYCTITVKDAYNAGNFDITTKLDGLKAATEAEQPEQEATYIYAIAVDTEVKFGTLFSVTVQEPLSPDHKKDYEEIPAQWKDRVSANQKFVDIQEKIKGKQLSSKESIAHLNELYELKNLIDPLKFESLTEVLKNNLATLADAEEALDALFETFTKSIEEATKKLKENKITEINFNGPYNEAKKLIAQHAELPATYSSQLENLVRIYKNYITEAIQTMIHATGLDTLHQKMYNKTGQVEALRAFSLNKKMNHALVSMLKQLKENQLFGVDSTVDYRQPESSRLQKALFAGYAYILVAYDAAEASLYDDFSTSEKIMSLFSGDYITLYDTAIKTMTSVVKMLGVIENEYDREFLKPFFTYNESYLEMYDKGKLSVLHFGLEQITDKDGKYIYDRNGIPEIYKNASFSVPPIDSLHKKDHIRRAKNWIAILSVIYQEEMLKREQQEILKMIHTLLLDLPIDGKTLSSMHSENTPFALLQTTEGQEQYSNFIDLLIRNLENESLLTGLAQLYEADKEMISDETRRQLTQAFACICANFDACIFWAYTEAKEGDIQLLRNAFRAIIPSIVIAIELCWTNYNEYFDSNGKQFLQRKFNVGIPAGAMISDPHYPELSQQYRYLIATPPSLLGSHQYTPVILKLNGVSLSLLINENHRKSYKKIIQQWESALKRSPLQKSQSVTTVLPQFTQSTPSLPEIVEQEVEEVAKPESKQPLSKSSAAGATGHAVVIPGVGLVKPYSKGAGSLFGKSTPPLYGPPAAPVNKPEARLVEPESTPVMPSTETEQKQKFAEE